MNMINQNRREEMFACLVSQDYGIMMGSFIGINLSDVLFVDKILEAEGYN